MSDSDKFMFLSAAKDWVCDSYAIEIRYLARKVKDELKVMSVLIGLAPIPFEKNQNFSVIAGELYAGLVQRTASKNELLDILSKAVEGKIEIQGYLLSLSATNSYSYYSDNNYKDLMFYQLHLKVAGDRDMSLPVLDSGLIDNALRRCDIPFDGFADLTGWLGLTNLSLSHDNPAINIHILPPVDLIFPNCRLEKGKFHIVLNAHPSFDITRLGLAIRVVSESNESNARMQVASKVTWKTQPVKMRREGKANISLKNANSVLVMLMIGEITARRQWIIDPQKISNNRLIAVRQFDKDLRMIRNAVFESSDATRFEMGVSALFFLMGFAPAVQIESHSPDIVVATPSGRLILIECTTKIADFSSKLGKLIDRKGALEKVLQENRNQTRVDGVLVCGLPRDQVGIDLKLIKTHQAVLLTREDMASAIERIGFNIDPDKFIDDSLARWNQSELMIQGT